MTDLRIAILSDLHIGQAARAPDLTTDLPNGGKKRRRGVRVQPPVEEDFLPRFTAFVRENDLRADCIVIPGDITDSASPSEFRLASSVVERLAQDLGVEKGRVFPVPGNHDVDWAVLRLGAGDPLRRKQRYQPLIDEFLSQEVSAVGQGSVADTPFLVSWETDGLIVFGYNSAWHDDPTVAMHTGRVDPEHVKALRSALEGQTAAEKKVKVFLVHHHPSPFSKPLPREGDFEAIINAEALLEVLAEFKFDIVVHGHKHVPRFRTEIVDGRNPLVIVGAGSFSARLDTRWAGAVANQFHMLECHQRRAADGVLQGRMRSWSYVYPKGWIPSTLEAASVRHLNWFGTYLNPGDIRAQVAEVTRTLLATQSVVRWPQIVRQLPDLEYLHADRIEDVVVSVAEGLRCDVAEGRDGSLIIIGPEEAGA